MPSWCAIKAQCGTPDPDQSSGSNTHCGTTTERRLMYYWSICYSIRCWFNRLWSERCSPLHGIFHYQQCSNSLAFFFFSHWSYGFIKGDSLPRRIFSNVFFSQPFPMLLSGKCHSQKPGKIWWWDQKERKDSKESWENGGKRRNDTLLPYQTPTSTEGNSSERSLFFQTQIQQNAGCFHETSKWVILTSEGLQMLEELKEQKVPAGC